MEKRLETKQMKLTKQTLKQIIKEEMQAFLDEGYGMSGQMEEKIKNWASNLMDARSVDVLYDVVNNYMRDAQVDPRTDAAGKFTPDIMKRIPVSISTQNDADAIEQVVAGMIQGLLDLR
tara:strand:- start:281 stop:637 length:357 start_codon:yes stop_codon:yes gene_type:complete